MQNLQVNFGFYCVPTIEKALYERSNAVCADLHMSHVQYIKTE